VCLDDVLEKIPDAKELLARSKVTCISKCQCHSRAPWQAHNRDASIARKLGLFIQDVRLGDGVRASIAGLMGEDLTGVQVAQMGGGFCKTWGNHAKQKAGSVFYE